MELKILIIEDDPEISKNLLEFYTDLVISDFLIKPQLTTSFDDGIKILSESDFDIVILDLFKDGDVKDENAGKTVLEEIRRNVFVPVIFYTGHAHKIDHLKSEVVGVIRKGDGIEALSADIERIITSKIALIKTTIYGHLKESLREYFWDTVDVQKDVFRQDENSVSLGYLILRRFASSLSKKNIKKILADERIDEDKIHPMEFYIYPIKSEEEYQTGEIISKEDINYIILTPNCDFVKRANGTRKVEKILLANVSKFSTNPDFILYKELFNKQNRDKTEENQFKNIIGKLKNWINNNQGDKDRHFFLPGTPFIENSVVDFQNKIMVTYEDLQNFVRKTRLDDPYAQSMVSSFIRYYNRIGFTDIDAEYVIKNLK